MLEGLLRQTNTVQRVVFQWGECTCLAVVLQEDKEPEVAEGRTWDRGLRVAEDKMYGTGGQHIVQSGRQPLVAYSERGPVASMKVDC